MTHEHEGHYSSKHPADAAFDPALAAAIREKQEAGCVACASAFTVAREHEISPAEVGKTIDLLDLRLVKCQLGLFGYPDNKAVTPADTIPSPLQAAIQSRSDEGRLSCRACWEIAEAQHLPKMTVSAACEALGIKIKPCQLGAF